MTARELIAGLEKLPPETRVVVSGYEEGYDDISSLLPILVKATPNPKPWEGRWESEESGEPVVFLFGRGREAE